MWTLFHGGNLCIHSWIIMQGGKLMHKISLSCSVELSHSLWRLEEENEGLVDVLGTQSYTVRVLIIGTKRESRPFIRQNGRPPLPQSIAVASWQNHTFKLKFILGALSQCCIALPCAQAFCNRNQWIAEGWGFRIYSMPIKNENSQPKAYKCESFFPKPDWLRPCGWLKQHIEHFKCKHSPDPFWLTHFWWKMP